MSSTSAASSERCSASRASPPTDAIAPILLKMYSAFAIFCIRVTADGTQIFAETLTNPGTPGTAPGDFRLFSFPRGAQSVTYEIKVVDADGRTLSTTETAKPIDLCQQ